jgi:selenium-binding protein 1
MQRRDFLKASAATAVTATTGIYGCSKSKNEKTTATNKKKAAGKNQDAEICCDRTYATVKDAMNAPPETVMYVPGIYSGTDVKKPDYLATVDVDPNSSDFGKVVHRLQMPNIGDELHHFGWNACSSCHGVEGKNRRFMVLPGITSSRIHIVDTEDPKAPKFHKIIEPQELFEKANLSAPHTVHCLADGNIMISCLGDAKGEAPGGFLMLNDKFEVTGRWENDLTGMNFNYDFWYQPRHNVMISSEWGAPNTVSKGFSLDDVAAGKYGKHIHFWDWKERKIIQSIDLGAEGMIPLEVRFHHEPTSVHGFVGAALSSTMWHWHKKDDKWVADKVITVDGVEDNDFPGGMIPGLITDLVLSMNDKYLYFSNWLHGDLRQYDVSDPANPKMTGQLWLGGLLGKEPSTGKKLGGGPQMLQLSLDGKRLYVSNSLYSPWDNMFYPNMAKDGSYVMQIDCDSENGGMQVNEKFFVDFGKEPDGPARAHEMRFPGGDCTSDIWS